jgi:hypothetical protein
MTYKSVRTYGIKVLVRIIMATRTILFYRLIKSIPEEMASALFNSRLKVASFPDKPGISRLKKEEEFLLEDSGKQSDDLGWKGLSGKVVLPPDLLITSRANRPWMICLGLDLSSILTT